MNTQEIFTYKTYSLSFQENTDDMILHTGLTVHDWIAQMLCYHLCFIACGYCKCLNSIRRCFTNKK